ncbi:MAG: serine hydrolase, partial [Bacteroidota bacterium]
TRYEIGSITKVFTGLLLAARVADQKVQLTNTIEDFLPDSIELNDHIGAIQLVQLATHSSGLSRQANNLHTKGYRATNPYAHYTPQLLLEEIEEHELVFESGKSFSYSNLGMGLLGHLLSNSKNQNYIESLSQSVLHPLKMNQTLTSLTGEHIAYGHTFNVAMDSWDFEALAGAGDLTSNIHDLLLFLSAQLGYRETPLKHAIELSQKQHFQVEKNKVIGLGWGIYKLENGDQLYRHNGRTAGFCSFIGFLKQAKKGVVVLSNSSQKGVDDIGLYFLDDSFKPEHQEKSIAYVVSELLERKDTLTTIDLLRAIQINGLNKDWGELNLLGYTYLKQQTNEKAIQVFKLNTMLYPNSADGYDSLGAAFFKDNQLEQSLLNYQKALEIDPNYSNAKNMIAKINRKIHSTK